MTQPVSVVWQVRVGPPAGLDAVQEEALTKPVSLVVLQVTVRPATGPPFGVQAPELAMPVSVVWQVMVWPPPEDAVQAAALTKPESVV